MRTGVKEALSTALLVFAIAWGVWYDQTHPLPGIASAQVPCVAK